MKPIFSLFVAVISFSVSFAQLPQFAVVRPDGTTYICPTFDSAYNKSNNGDNIYLPGGNFSLSNPISKSLNIYGAGYNQDSSAVTNITTLSGLIILHGAENGSIQGIQITSPNPQTTVSMTFGDNTNSPLFTNYTIKYCSLTYGIHFQVPSSNISILNNFIGYYGNYYSAISIRGAIANSLISNNIINGIEISSGALMPYLQVNNNIFFYYYTEGNTYFQLARESTYQNNIFQSGSVLWNTANSNFFNNTNGIPYGSPGNTYSGTVIETFNLSFMSPGTPVAPHNYYNYDVHNDYHIKPTSLCKNSGTDGTDRGIYGGTFSWKEGSVPSNPHIYFKQVGQQTNSNGLLQIEFKVRTGNN